MIFFRRLLLSTLWLFLTVQLVAQNRSAPNRSRQNSFQEFKSRIDTSQSQDSLLNKYISFAAQYSRRNPDVVDQILREIEQFDEVSEHRIIAHKNILKAYNYNNSMPDSALFYADKALSYFKITNEAKVVINLLNLKGQLNSRLNNYLLAEESYFEALKFVKEFGLDERGILNELTKLYMRVGAIEIALERYNQILELEVDPNRECATLINISNAHKRNHDLEKAKQTLLPCENNFNISEEILVAVYRSLSDLERIMGNYDQQISLINKAIELEQKIGQVNPTTYLFLADAYFETQNFDKVDSLFNIIERIDPRLVIPPTKVHLLLLQSKFLILKNELDIALKKIDLALPIIARLPKSPLEIEALKLKAEIYEKKSDLEKAYEITKTFAELNDIIKERSKIREESMSRVRFQMREKNNDLIEATSQIGLLKVRNAIIIIVLILIAVYVIYRYRIHYILKEQKTRNEIARDLHDDLSSTLSSIHFFSEAAKKKQTKDSDKFLDLIDSSAIEAKEKINDIIWSIDPENDDWEIFLTKSSRFAAEMFESQDIEYQININPKEEIHLNIMYRKDLWLVFKELVTNLVRHSNASFAEISLFSTKELTMLIVEDNGKGFDESKSQMGNGLSNIRNRVASVNPNNQIRLTSSAEKGTRWEIGFKI